MWKKSTSAWTIEGSIYAKSRVMLGQSFKVAGTSAIVQWEYRERPHSAVNIVSLGSKLTELTLQFSPNFMELLPNFMELDTKQLSIKKNAYQSKVTSPATISHVQFVTDIIPAQQLYEIWLRTEREKESCDHRVSKDAKHHSLCEFGFLFPVAQFH